MTNTSEQESANSFSRLKNIHVRTMNSDIKSIKEQGGGEPKPYTPSPQQFPPSQPASQTPGVFQPPQVEPIKPPEKPPQEPVQVMGGEAPVPPKSNKKVFVTLLVVLIIIAVGVAAYFFLPALLGGEDENGVTLPQEEEFTESEEEFEVPVFEPEEEQAEGAEGAEGAEEGTGKVPAEFHVSLFTAPTDTTAFIEPASLDLEGVKNALTLSPTEVPLFREVVLKDAEGNMLPFKTVVQIFAPTVFTDLLVEMFESDITFFTYTDDDGTWLGFAARITEGVEKTEAENQVALLENNVAELQNFYLESPGSSGVWKDGSVGDITSRYLTFEQADMAFNYGWANNVLLISTSYPVFQEAEGRL